MNELQMRMFQYKTKLKLTNKEIAKRTGYSVATIDRIASGKIKAPKLTTIRQIASVFGVTVEELIGQEKAVEPCFFDKKTAEIAQTVKEKQLFIDLFEACRDFSDEELRTLLGIVKMLKK